MFDVRWCPNRPNSSEHWFYWHYEITYCHNHPININQYIVFRLIKNAYVVAFTFDTLCKLKFAFNKCKFWPASSPPHLSAADICMIAQHHSAHVKDILGHTPFSSSKQHLSYDDCLEVRGEINYSVLHYVLKLCTVISTLRWAVLTVPSIRFCLAGPISLCLDSLCLCLCFFVLSCHTAYVLYCNMVGWTWWFWILILRTFLQCFDIVGWVIWSVKTRLRYDT